MRLKSLHLLFVWKTRNEIKMRVKLCNDQYSCKLFGLFYIVFGYTLCVLNSFKFYFFPTDSSAECEQPVWSWIGTALKIKKQTKNLTS